MKRTIVVVADTTNAAELLRDALRKRGFEAISVCSGQECLDLLETCSADVVVAAAEMSGMTGIELCAMLRDRHPDLASLVIANTCDLDTAIAAIRAGAYDFITPIRIDALAMGISRALDHVALAREVRHLRTEHAHTVSGITGASPAMHTMLALIEHVACSDASVLITGESGSGKELVARALHDQSHRREHPFVAINCAAMPASLLESELFGHARGAFTDAKQDRKGLFVAAGEGTILLDEIGEMPTEMQVKLLRVLQERTVRPLGGDVEIPFAARVITSTNRDLEHEVVHKRFRDDLFYRINVVQIVVPPLRERVSDILPLAQLFIERAARRSKKAVRGISIPAARLLLVYDWPGNIRELENFMERAVALCRLDMITIDDLPAKLQDHGASLVAIATHSLEELITMVEMERRYVRQVLGLVGGNKTQAARVLGIDRRSLYRRLEPAQTATPASAPVTW